MTPIRRELEGLAIRDDGAARETWGRDESDQGSFPPDFVVFAESAADVVRVVRACGKHQVPVIPVGARNGKSGGSLPKNILLQEGR